jgi:hypothetical protein
MTKIVHALIPRTDRGNDPNDHRDDPEYLNRVAVPDPFDWTEEFTLTDAEVDGLVDPVWIVPDLIIQGHLVIVVAEPNGGKTTIFAHLAGDMVQAGYRVLYVNADIAGSNAADFIERAKAGGWAALLPDMKAGRSMQDVVAKLEAMNETGADVGGVVLILDTLKKCVDVIAKAQARKFLQLLRSLSAKGMTIIALAHTNKYHGADGKPVFEGVGDLRSDADELIYFIPVKNEDGTMTVSTEPDKVRGDFQPITFTIAKDRTVTRAEQYIDTATEREREQRYRDDEVLIDFILDALAAGVHKQTEIITRCKAEAQMGKRTVLRVLRDYGTPAAGRWQRWDSQRGFEHNTLRYYPLHREK